MSCNRENIAWQDEDGTWSVGFFEFYVYGEDHEWDVDYDYTRFGWAGRGYATPDEGYDDYGHDHANPGMQTVEHDVTDEQRREWNEMRDEYMESRKRSSVRWY